MGVAIIGVGAIGGLVAAELLAAGHEVTLCTRTPVRRLIVERDEHARDLTAPENPVAPVRFAFVALKGHDSAQATPWLERLEPEFVVVLQNGVEHETQIAHPRLVPAIANTAVERTAPGHLIHRAGDLITLADRPGAAEFAALLDGSALQTKLEGDFQTAAWRKLLTNLAGNPITALTERRSDVFEDPPVRELARAVLEEAVAIGRAEGARLAPEDIERTLGFYAALPPDTGSSMLYDRLAGRPLEIDTLVGAVLRAAARHSLPAPRIHTLYALLTSIAARAGGP
jgi:2-dehydropantoate 2-reductase